MTPEDAFYTLYRELGRVGPGAVEDIGWLLSQIDPPGRVVDAACGPGADSETLASLLPDAVIEAVDLKDHFVAEAGARLARFGPRIRVRQGDMAEITGPADLVWCAGGVYFMGVGAALSAWRPALAERGVVAFSEPVALADPMSAAAQAFWADYPGIGTADDVARQVAAAGYRMRATRPIIGAPWLDYYLPLMARAQRLRTDASPELARVLDEAEAEFARWRAAPGEIAYLLCLTEPA